MSASPVLSALMITGALLAAATGCAHPPSAPQNPRAAAGGGGFRSGDCNLVSDDDVKKATRSASYTKVVSGDAGCFWQEDTMLGSFGAGMGISTWWYRGSDMDIERMLEHQAGRRITELELNGNKGFKAWDANACSFYVAKNGDVITWSIQTLNPSSLPDLCTVTQQLAQLSQDRVN